MTVASHRYTTVAIILHWLIVIGIVVLITIGLAMTHDWVTTATKFKLFQLHKSIGITILGLVLVRLVWRLAHRPPALPETMPQLEQKAAAGTHYLFYLLMIGLPLTGWALVSVAPLNIPTILFGLLRWPHIGVLASLHNKAPVAAVFNDLHSYGAWVLIALILLHAAAALRHHFFLQDDVLRRMLPGFSARGTTSADTSSPQPEKIAT